MTDDDKPKRPNANYKLSKPDGIEISKNENLTFYYSRERRLEKAPQAVKDLYEGRPHRFNLLRPLVADRPRAILFFTILILCVFLIVLAFIGRLEKVYRIDGNRIEVTGTIFEDSTLIVLRKTILNTEDNPHTGAVNIAVSPLAGEGEEYSVYYHRIFFTLENAEEYRFLVPFNDSNLLMVLQTEKSELHISFSPR